MTKPTENKDHDSQFTMEIKIPIRLYVKANTLMKELDYENIESVMHEAIRRMYCDLIDRGEYIIENHE